MDEESAYHHPGPCGAAQDGTTQQDNTHNTEILKVQYPWHPFYDREVLVRGRQRKSEYTGFRCTLKEEPKWACIEIPEWMFDRALCSLMLLKNEPFVFLIALEDLRKLLDETVFSSTSNAVEHQQCSLDKQGGADAKRMPITSSRTNPSFPPAQDSPSLEESSPQNPTKCDTTVSENALRASRASQPGWEKGRGSQ